MRETTAYRSYAQKSKIYAHSHVKSTHVVPKIRMLNNYLTAWLLAAWFWMPSWNYFFSRGLKILCEVLLSELIKSGGCSPSAHSWFTNISKCTALGGIRAWIDLCETRVNVGGQHRNHTNLHNHVLQNDAQCGLFVQVFKYGSILTFQKRFPYHLNTSSIPLPLHHVRHFDFTCYIVPPACEVGQKYCDLKNLTKIGLK